MIPRASFDHFIHLDCVTIEYSKKISTLPHWEIIVAFVLLHVNFLIANPTKWPNTLKQFVSKLPTNCLSVFGDFKKLALKGLTFFFF